MFRLRGFEGKYLLFLVFQFFLLDNAISIKFDPDSITCQEARGHTKDIGHSIAEIREKEKIKNSCEKYYSLSSLESLNQTQEQSIRKSFILCGKEIFFFLTGLQTSIGVPEKLSLALTETFPEITGEKFEKLGFLTDQSIQNERWPLGYVHIKKRQPLSPRSITSGKVHQISCAGCHVSQLNDGRFAVGAPNQNLDLGTFNALGAYTFWRMDANQKKTGYWDKNIIKYYQELDKTLKKSKKKNMITRAGFIKKLRLQNFILSLLNENPTPLSSQYTYINGKPGVYNHLAPMMRVPEKIFYITPPQIWNLHNYREKHNTNKMTLGFANESDSLESFIKQAIVLTTLSKKFTKDQFIKPLVTYTSCLETPKKKQVSDLEKIARGKKTFERRCTQCHQSENGDGRRIYASSTVNSPIALYDILTGFQPKDDQTRKVFKIFDKIGVPIVLPKGLAPRRLNGIWAKKKIMHNGQIEGLDHLFCLGGKSRNDFDTKNPLLDGTHSDLCEDFSEAEKKELKAYLETL